MATNATTGDDLMYWQANNYPESEIVLQVVPTAPFIKPKSIDNAITLLLEKKVDSVVGCQKEVFYFWKNGKPNYRIDGRIPNSFELPPLLFETTGLYVNRTSFVLKTKLRINVSSCVPYILPKIECTDINTPEDLEYARIIYRGLYSQ